MSQIIKKGKLPRTPHTEYYEIPNVLALEEIHGSFGFSGPFTRKLHIRKYPTIQSKKPEKAKFNFHLKSLSDNVLQPFHIYTNKILFEGDFISSRKPLLFGQSTVISVCKPVQNVHENAFFKNGEKHELYYVHPL
mgnify:CR=1 FL=1